MQKQLKILVIRFSSIGDIILTTPVVRCLKLQTNAKVHYLTKKKYKSLLYSNDYIDQLFLLDNNFNSLLKQLEYECYDYVIDLHNNLRTKYLKLKLNVKAYSLSKDIIKRFLLINFGANLLNNHVVERYFKTIKFLNITDDNKGIDFTLNKEEIIDYNFKQDYLAWCIGGTYNQKKLSVNQIKEVVEKINIPVVFLGGDKEAFYAQEVVRVSKHQKLVNFCGKLSINQSAYIIKYSKLFLTNDTGLMHIATSFKVPILSFWGCTKPSLGFYTFQPKMLSKNIVAKNSTRPCSRHGNYCRYYKEGCVKTIAPQKIVDNILEMLN